MLKDIFVVQIKIQEPVKMKTKKERNIVYIQHQTAF